MQQDNAKPRLLDTTISVQRVVSIVLAGAIAVGGWVWTIDKRATALEASDREQEKHFSRIEGTMVEQRSDTRDSLRNISQDIKDLSNKVDQLKDQMIASSVANRPGIDKWSKP